jgi:hypothetical protein
VILNHQKSRLPARFMHFLNVVHSKLAGIARLDSGCKPTRAQPQRRYDRTAKLCAWVRIYRRVLVGGSTRPFHFQSLARG